MKSSDSAMDFKAHPVPTNLKLWALGTRGGLSLSLLFAGLAWLAPLGIPAAMAAPKMDPASGLPILELPLPDPVVPKLVFVPIPLKLTGDGSKVISVGNPVAGYAKRAQRNKIFSGSFKQTVGDKVTYYYYLGQTEVTRAQWGAMQKLSPANLPGSADASALPLPSGPDAGQYPQTSVSPMAIEGSITAYYDWLITKHPDVLPGSGLSKAEVRLPYEDEWEFAARGGDAGDSASYEAPYPYPTSEPLDAYEWYYKDGDLPNPRRVAGKKPSSLGLYDMLGNIGEMVGGRFDMGGQQGAMIVRGRDITARETEINAAERKEFARYTTTGESAPLQPNKHPYIGFRLALGSLKAITDDEKLKELAKLEEQINKRQNSTVPPSEAVPTLPTLSTIEELSRAAEADPSKAMQLAKIYETQMGDDLKARKYYDLAAKQGLADATAASLQLLRKRYSETGATEIFVEEGRLLEEPLRDGINPPSPTIKQAGEIARQREAFEKYEKAARSGVAVGRMEMARCRWFGIGTTIDPRRAKKELDDLKEDFPELKGLDAFTSRIEQDIAIAEKVYSGIFDPALDFQLIRPALKYLAQKDSAVSLGLIMQKVAKKKSSDRVANFLYSGLMTLADSLPPALPDADAITETGYALGIGCGVERNAEKAIRKFQQAQDLGDYTGTALRAYQLLENSADRAVDLELGIELMRHSADAGHPYASNQMAYYYLNGTLGGRFAKPDPSKRNLDEAFRYAEQAAGKDYAFACALLGNMYVSPNNNDNELYRRRDIRKALSWYEKGAALGDNYCDSRAKEIMRAAFKALTKSD